jgi:hypothetical protein
LKTVNLIVEHGQFQRLSILFQKGIRVRVRVNTTVKNVLCDQLELDPQYVRERISTIFLDGRPVDDIDAATVKQGSVLALSAAMPGLVGATMRRNGVYKEFRNTITHREEAQVRESTQGVLIVKILNLLIPELGPLLLERGILLAGAELADLVARLPNASWDRRTMPVVDGTTVTPAEIRQGCAADPDHSFLLTVKVAPH